jgi:hypothetical protein
MRRTPPVVRLPPLAFVPGRGLPELARVGALGFMASLGLLLAACRGTDLGPCTAQQVVVDSTFRAYTDSGLPIASFALHQVFGGSAAACSNEAPIRLAISSEAVAPLAFRYTLRGYDERGGNAWIFLGAVARLAPGDTIDEGTVARSRVRVDVNTRVGFDSVRVVP